ncbi:unnamed protein product [Symbiodinium microadriaticum]|nr:unnamed protein product [Symbiodinium microadriaticum]
MALVCSQSFYEFLCEGDATRLLEGAEVPRCILEQFPVTVHDRSLIQVPGPRMQRNICDRIINNHNCDRLSNCPHIHPDFIAERWVVPDLLCHKWFQGTCGFGERCWNQHGETFDKAIALAMQTQQGLRREMAPFMYDPGAAGGWMRQVDREEARRYIKATVMQFRMSTIKKWKSWHDEVHFEIDPRPDEAQLHLDQQTIDYTAEVSLPAYHEVPDTASAQDHDTSGQTFLRWAQHGDGIRCIFGSKVRCCRFLFPPRRCGGTRPNDTDGSTFPSRTVSLTTMARPTTAFSDDCRGTNGLGWGSAGDAGERNPPVGFITSRRFTGFPVMSMSLPQLTRLGANNVSMLPPGNHPYAAFAPDAPWEISYDGVLYLDQVLNSPTIRSILTPFGLFVDFPVYDNSQLTLEERVLFLGVPNNFHDPQTTLIYSMVWHTITASLSELHHTSVEARFDRLRGWCLFSLDVYRVSVNYSYINWISMFMRLIGDPIIDCAWAMLPPNMRTYFAGHPDMVPYFTAEPPNFVLRRKRPFPLYLRFTPFFTMAPRRASELKHDKIEQYPDTQPMEEDDPIESTTAPSQSSDAVLPAARALADLTRGVEPDSVEGRLMKQRRRLYDEQTAQVAVEVLAFRRAQEQMGLARLRTRFSNADSNQLFEIWRRHLAGEAVDPDGNPLPSYEAEVIETDSAEGNKRLLDYLGFLSAKHDDPKHEKSLDCSFCGKLFPAYYLLCINPAELDDWRNLYYRCCYSCATCHSEDFVWYSECSGLKPAKLGARGSISGERYNNFDRTTVADFDDDNENTPGQWHIAIDKTAGSYATFYFDSVRDEERSRWTRRPVFRRKGQVVTNIDVKDWYALCSKVITFRRRHISEQVRDRNSSWKAMCDAIRRERPGTSSAGVRREVRARILALTARFVADMDKLDADRRAQVMVAFEQWQVSSIARAIDPNWDGDAFWDMAINDAPLTDWLFKVTDSLDQHFICRNVECTSVIHNHHWLHQISTDYPSMGAIPALIMAENGEVNVETPVRGQTISKEHGDYHLFLMEWEKTDDDMLLGRLKQIMAEYRADLGTEDFRAPLQAAIRDQAVKYQLLGYFEETAWTLENMENIFNRNFTANRKNIYRPDLLPTMAHPHKYLDETFNTKENFESYGIAEYRKDPPYYHFSVYEYDPETTVIMKQNDFLLFMSLCYIQLRAMQYLQGDHTFTNVSRDHLELLRQQRRERQSAMSTIPGSDVGAEITFLFVTGYDLLGGVTGSQLRHKFGHKTGPAPSSPVTSPDLDSHMDTSAIRHLEALVDGLNRQINGLRFRIETIRTKTRAEARRRVTEIAHVYENYVPIEIFMASARSEVTARVMLERRISELRAENEQLREQIYLLQFQLEPLLGLPLALRQLRDEGPEARKGDFLRFVTVPTSTVRVTFPNSEDTGSSNERHPRMTFADLLAFLRAHDLVGFAPCLASRDILSVDALRHIPETTLVQISPTRPDLDKMLAALGRRPMSRAVVPVARRDLPSSTPSARGSLSKALMAARPEYRDESLNELRKNTYAATTTRSRDSRWKLWLQITNAWDLDALPLTVRSVDAVAASLRVGGYKTANKLLFSQARQEHVAQTHTPVPPEVILRMTQAERAVERGRGPSKLKDSFYVEDIARIDTTDREFPTQIQWAICLSHRLDMVIICCWWLLRGIEAASVMLWTEVTYSGRFPLDTVQLLGRWGSDAIKVYVQEARVPGALRPEVQTVLQAARGDGSVDSIGRTRFGTLHWYDAGHRSVTTVIGPSRLKDTMADATLSEAAALAGIDLSTDCLARYLHAIGLRSHATIAAYVHEDTVVTDLLTKLKAGVTVGTTEYKLADDAEENALNTQWPVLSRHARFKHQASFQATPTPNSAPSHAATTTQPDKDNIPKALPSGVYSKLVEDYNAITLDGVRRVFPEKLLLGAEKVLARMYHEHHTSKFYTATPLGEIMAQRVWTSFNTINSNRKKDPSKKKLILDDKNQISEKTQEEWDVKGQWMLIDATQAIHWAWILLKYDSETAINKYVDWFHGLIRKNAQRIPNVKLLWEDFAWDIAMRTEIPDVLTLYCIDNLDTVAITIYIVATPTTYVDLAADATSMDYADSHNAAYAHTDADDTFRPGTDDPTATYVGADGESGWLFQHMIDVEYKLRLKFKGRPMPQTNRSRPVSPSTTQRWQDDHHRYPPWQYEEQFLTQWPDGSFSTAPTELREQLQGLQMGYTERLAGGDYTQRDVALGNAWHLPTAVWILFLVLLGTADAALPRSPHESALDKVVNLWMATRVPFGPPPRRSGSEYMPQFSWTEYLDWALHRDTNMTPKDLDPTLNWCLEHRHLFHPLTRFQHDVIAEIKDLILDFEEHTLAWFHTLPPHVQRAYKHKDSVTQIPILIHLLRRLGYPQTEVLYRELSEGFPLMGKLTPGVNWHVRQDRKYLQPTPMDDFKQKNREYIRNKLETNRVDDHWKFMLDEVLAEVKLGRMNGPFEAAMVTPRFDEVRIGEGLAFLENNRSTPLRVWGHDHEGLQRLSTDFDETQ